MCNDAATYFPTSIFFFPKENCISAQMSMQTFSFTFPNQNAYQLSIYIYKYTYIFYFTCFWILYACIPKYCLIHYLNLTDTFQKCLWQIFSYVKEKFVTVQTNKIYHMDDNDIYTDKCIYIPSISIKQYINLKR